MPNPLPKQVLDALHRLLDAERETRRPLVPTLQVARIQTLRAALDAVDAWSRRELSDDDVADRIDALARSLRGP